MGEALRRWRQEHICKFEASLVYRVSSRTARAVTQRNPCIKRLLKRVVVVENFANYTFGVGIFFIIVVIKLLGFKLGMMANTILALGRSRPP